MPETAELDPSGYKKGHFGDVSLDDVKKSLKKFQSIIFHPGCIPETFKPIRDNSFAFVHIDVDLYRSSFDCCEFFYERMTKGGIMIFDDYGFEKFKESAKKAVDDFFNDKPEVPISLHTAQCLLIKL